MALVFLLLLYVHTQPESLEILKSCSPHCSGWNFQPVYYFSESVLRLCCGEFRDSEKIGIGGHCRASHTLCTPEIGTELKTETTLTGLC